MKKFIAIYLSILCTFPILANGNVPCSTYSATNNNQNGNRTGCLTHGGCEWFSFDKICSPCSSDKYHPACSNPDSTDCQDACSSCTDSSTGNWLGGAQTVLNSTFDTTNTQTGMEYCPWVCNSGYFSDSGHSQCLSCPTNNNGFMTYPDNNDVPTSDCANTCDPGTYIIDTLSSAGSSTHRYYCGQCGLGTPSGGTVSTCACYDTPGVVQIYGGGPDRTAMRVECECTAGATWQDGACKCGVNTYLTPTNDGYICQSCPTNSSTLQQIGKTSPDECLCDAGYYMSRNECKSCPEHANCSYYGKTYENVQCASGYQKIPDPDTQTFVCRSCSDAHAQLDNNGTGNCLCDPGYYGEIQGLQTSCKQCPIGTTTTTIGATQRSDCQMNHNTKFCYGSGDNKKCMNLIPAGTSIYAPNNT